MQSHPEPSTRHYPTRRRTRRPKRLIAALSAASLALLGLLATSSGPGQAASLPGSNFEIDTDANLTVDGAAPAEDWISVPAADENRQTDKPTGATDDSFGQGTKEDTAVPTVVDGSIPNNKSDLRHFGAYLETTTVGGETERFLNVFWHRVQEPTGTTNMDFEFNKSTTASGNGVTPVRTAGDVLIQYDLSQGGTNPTLWLSRWVTTGPGSLCQANNATPCWGTRVNLSAAGDATGSINTSPITEANSDGLGAMSARTFGEAQIDFDALAGSDACTSFGSAYLKSRSSDSFTAALKDFIAPVPLNFNICGTVHVIKHDDADPANLLDGAAFDLVEDVAPLNNVGGPGPEDTNVVDSCVTGELPGSTDDGVCDFTNVAQGEYWVVETAAPPGYDLPATPYQHVTVTADETVEVTFVDPRQRGAIEITKLRKHAADGAGDHPQSGVEFTVEGQSATVTTGADGTACVDGLLFGDYDVTETVPTGYHAVDPTTQNVVVDHKATCDGEGDEAPNTVTFHNTPLTDLSVSVDSQVDGGTASDIECKDADDATVASGSTDANGDGSASATDLEPGTYTCTVVIDP